MEPNLPIIPIEEQFRIMADTAPVLIWIANVDKLCYFFNAGWLRYTGRTLEQEYGNGWADGVHPDDLERCLYIYTSSFDARKEFKMEYRLRRHDGQYLWLLDHGVPRYLSDGTFAGYIGSCMVIDELLNSERVQKDYIRAEALETQQALNEELASSNEELAASNEELAAINEQLHQTQESLAHLNRHLEDTVTLRTKALSESEAAAKVLNEELASLNEELAAANEEMAATNEEITAINEELMATNEELTETQEDLRRINSELEESEYRLTMAIEATQLGTWDYNHVTREVYWSAETKKIFGLLSGQHLSFEEFLDRIHPDDRKRIVTEIDQVVTSQRDGRYDVSYRFLRPDEQVCWVRVQGTVYLGTDGQPIRYLGTILDITASKLAQEALLRSEKLFKSIALNIPGSVVIVIDKDHRYVMIEGDIMEKLGYDSRDYVGKHPSEVGSAERYEASKQLYDRVLSGEEFSVERRGTDGEYYMVHFVPLKDEQDEVERGLIIALDITDIKEAEEKSAKLAAIIESSDDAIVSKTFDSVITSWNDSAERIFGYTAEEIIGETIYKIIPPDRHDEEPMILASVRAGKRVEHFETKRLTKDGRLIDVSVTVSPVKDKQGNIIGLSKIARDITEQKKDEVRKNDFIGMVSHELKTPLTSLSAILQVAQAKLKDSDDAFLSGAMNKANTQVKRMSGMINGFLNISRLESGKIMIDKRTFDLEEMISEVIDEVKLTVNSHQLNFIPCAATEVYADHDKISSVISNLISNAVKYSPRGKNVDITCEVSEGKAIVSVKDEGMGIKAQDIDKIFDRYYRVQSNHTQHISGFGIGLYLSAEIVRRHGGEIWAESESGKGSKFTFSIPVR
jgi:PAS domain S-box-containing protein